MLASTLSADPQHLHWVASSWKLLTFSQDLSLNKREQKLSKVKKTGRFQGKFLYIYCLHINIIYKCISLYWKIPLIFFFFLNLPYEMFYYNVIIDFYIHNLVFTVYSLLISNVRVFLFTLVVKYLFVWDGRSNSSNSAHRTIGSGKA